MRQVCSLDSYLPCTCYVLTVYLLCAHCLLTIYLLCTEHEPDLLLTQTPNLTLTPTRTPTPTLTRARAGPAADCCGQRPREVRLDARHRGGVPSLR